MDIVYAVDTSASITGNMLNDIISILMNSIGSFKSVSDDGTHVGLMTYSDQATVEMSLPDGIDKVDLNQKIMSFRLHGGKLFIF